MKLGDVIEGIYFEVPFRGRVTSFDCSYFSVDLSEPITVFDVKRDGVALRHDQADECRIVGHEPGVVTEWQGHVFIRKAETAGEAIP